jgi:hypothetical protein
MLENTPIPKQSVYRPSEPKLHISDNGVTQELTKRTKGITASRLFFLNRLAKKFGKSVARQLR